MTFDKNMFLNWVQNKMDNDQEHKEARNSSYLSQQKTQGDIFNALNKEQAPSLFDSIARVTNNESEKKNLSDNVELDESLDLEEKNVPNDPKKWAASKAAAKAKFDVYPSAYANAWASKDYKSKGGTWRKAKSEDVEYDQVDELKKSTLMNYKDKAKAQRNDIARRNQSVKGPLIGKDADQMIKRGKGVDLATKKLVAREYEKEDVDEGYNVTATHDDHMKASAAIGSGTSRRGPLAGGKSLGDGKYNLRFDSEKTGKKFMQKHGFKEDVDESLLKKAAGAALAGGAAYAAHKLSKPENRKKVGDAVKNFAAKHITPERKEKIKSGLKAAGKEIATAAAERLKQKVKDKVGGGSSTESGSSESKPESKPERKPEQKLRIAR